ncbi:MULTISPECIES: ATP-dependent helicase [Bacteroidota]|jgi:superfamily I DNA/RNA helicase|uniref:DNA 3'-5' helicase n=4 Tax=Bacteroidota TaxID=976 RepID=A0A1X7HWV6_9SPHI|nr:MULTISPECIES: ATP-dependent helicase [Bacteroidota]EHM7981517.1 ATP-dependent helicase [Elizabethkingia anophelis]EHM8033120.1 ATP-dependent helicase [Elizabethkingia anophelis]EHZ9535728.1 ATP-dependent helicase [Elizabethkingia anophelis]EKU3673636.1 ATP-dependent helicase [Elizabethkingia anophelis]EKU4210616.1 ATP-dependent helicase [Elizabethkingia anophelis]
MYYENEERLAYLQARGKVILNACPGSGKTTTIAKKILNLENLKEVGGHSGVACLSFTNSAKDEINEAYRKLAGKSLQFPNHVSTIDSFINKYITLPFYNLLNRDFNRPKILDHTTILDDMWKTTYVKNGKTLEGLLRPLNNPEYKAKNNRSIYHLYPPSEIRIEPNGSFSINGNQPSSDKVEKVNFDNYCKLIKNAQFRKGLISTGDSAFIALHLLKNNPKICRWLSLRFPFIIIDEAQDNSLMQHAIFEELVKQGLNNIELIGDPYQSLYEWRDAKPSEFLRKYENDATWNSYDLTDNRRSPQSIIDIFSKVRRSDDLKINSVDCENITDSIVIYKYSNVNHQLIIKHYDDSCSMKKYISSCIVVRGNSLKDALLGAKTEQRPWGIDLPKQIIYAKNLYTSGDIKNAIKEIRTICIPLMHSDEADYHLLKEIEKEKSIDPYFNSLMITILDELPAFSKTIQDWTAATQQFLKSKLGLSHEVDFNLRSRKSKYLEKSTLAETVSQHFKKSFSTFNIPITTIHQVKGQTLDSILVFFNERKHKDNITFDNISNIDNGFPDETKRLIYVALSRPRHLLAMAFPHSVTDNELKQKFGNEIRIIKEEELNQL